MKLFKITNPSDDKIYEKVLSSNEEGRKEYAYKVILDEKSSMIKDEAFCGKLSRENDFLRLEEYALPYVEVLNPSDVEVRTLISGSEVVIAPKKSIVVDKALGAQLLALYSFLIGKEYERKEKKATKAVKTKSRKKS